MVTGLDRFREAFADLSGHYVLIGGTACSLAFEDVGLEFRATKDLDIVLWVELLNPAFAQRFWDFVRHGGYSMREGAQGQRQLFRFARPERTDYPAMLELFSRRPDGLAIPQGVKIAPMTIEEEIASLSAILLDDSYYNFIRTGIRETEGLPWLDANHLLPMKARAWLDLCERKEQGTRVDSRDIRKHRNDVFRLYRILEPQRVQVPRVIQQDIKRFVDAMLQEPVDLRALELTGEKRNVLEDMLLRYTTSV